MSIFEQTSHSIYYRICGRLWGVKIWTHKNIHKSTNKNKKKQSTNTFFFYNQFKSIFTNNRFSFLAQFLLVKISQLSAIYDKHLGDHVSSDL